MNFDYNFNIYALHHTDQYPDLFFFSDSNGGLYVIDYLRQRLLNYFKETKTIKDNSNFSNFIIEIYWS